METKKKFYINNIYTFLILGVVMLSVMDAYLGDTSIVRLATIGYTLISIMIFIFRTSEFQFNSLLLIIYIWTIFNLIWLLFSYNDYYLSVIIQQIVLLLFIWSASNGDNPLKNINQLKYIILLFQAFAVLNMLFTERTGFATPLFAFAFFTLSMASRNWNRIMICCFFMLIFWYSEERSRVLALLVIAICIFLLPRLTKKFYKITYWAIVIIIISIPKIYLWIYNLPGSSKLNVLIREISGKNLFSGREQLWIYLEKQLSESLLFGRGGNLVGGSHSVELFYGMSSHNLVLFLRGQGGYFLLFLFAMFLYYIWVGFYDYLSNPYVLVGAAYLIGLLVRASFDLVLMANNFVDSLILWLPLVIALSLSHYMRQNKQRIKNVTD